MSMDLFKSFLRASLTSACDVIVHGFTPIGAFLIAAYTTRNQTTAEREGVVLMTCAVLVCVLWVDVKKAEK